MHKIENFKNDIEIIKNVVMFRTSTEFIGKTERTNILLLLFFFFLLCSSSSKVFVSSLRSEEICQIINLLKKIIIRFVCISRKLYTVLKR